MTASAAPDSVKIFISYRWQDTRDVAGRLSDRLIQDFGRGSVFMDVVSVEPGQDFAEVISRAVASCQVLLALIGRQWLTVTDENGRRRLDDPNDYVRLEIEAALELDVLVIPVLVEGAIMPRAQDLPASLVKLARRRALAIRYESFRVDADNLVMRIKSFLSPGAAQVLRHHSQVNAVAFSLPDGRLLVTGSNDYMAQTWEVASGQERRGFPHNDWVRGVAFSSDGRWLATGSNLGTARVWWAASGQLHREVTHSSEVFGEVFGVAFSPDRRLLATAGADGTARVWEVASGQEHQRFTHDGVVRGVEFSPDGALLATASDDGTARVWKVTSGQEWMKATHEPVVWGVAFSPDGRLLATAGEDGTAWVWEVAGRQQRRGVTHDGVVRGVAFSPDGRLLATASRDGTARVWEVAGGQERRRVTHDGVVRGVAFSPDGRLLATASYDRTAAIWEIS